MSRQKGDAKKDPTFYEHSRLLSAMGAHQTRQSNNLVFLCLLNVPKPALAFNKYQYHYIAFAGDKYHQAMVQNQTER
eukprot:1125384-Pelagomonas_calceolata.AAC.1